MDGFTIFDTAIGRCGIAWNMSGIAAVQLPERDDHGTRACLLRRYPAAVESRPPLEPRAAVEGIVALLAGQPSDLSDLRLDMRGVPPFHARVYAVARTIPPGLTLTYGEIAQRLGEPGVARTVGYALGCNPFVILVPCHRVMAAGGKTGGFSASGGVTTKLRLLMIESAQLIGRSTERLC